MDMDTKEAGRLGGSKRWSKIKGKRRRSDLMRKVAQARWQQSKKTT